ncbi:MAG: GlsB/YeaQ/YmgE family stress response membrane protein [Anaerolineales bacterium]|nr:GlsB/YeaQ/YmgE family stress response membrane protein [Anaerolineales bacterium]
MLVNLILWIILGAVAGWIASMIMKRDAQMGAAANIIVGIVGALIGGFLFNLVGLPGDTGFNLWTLLVATVGAVVLLFLLGVIRRAA